MAQKKIGDTVYIPELDQFGEISEIDPDGNVIGVTITTKDGDTQIEVTGVEVIVLQLVSWLVRLIRKWFGKNN